MSEESNLSDVTSQESSFTNYDTEGTIQSTATIPSDTLNIKKVAWNADEESIRKFTQGEPIIDQRNPFKTTYRSYEKKSPAHTRIPQIKREQFKNAVNSLKKSTSDELITTEEVLKQSKYVKTYIKNPDPYFVYDPAVLARLKADEQQRKQEATKLQIKKDSFQALKKKIVPDKQTKDVKTLPKSKIPYKKCAKPNYPNLADIRVKVGTDIDGSYLNPAEVKTNAKKFDECVKLKKHLHFDEDSEDMEEQLEKSNTDEEIITENPNETHSNKESNETRVTAESINGSFTNTINSKDFQQYLEKKGLVLTPQRTVHDNKTTRIYTTPPKPKRTSIIQKAPEFKESIYQRPSSLLVIEPESTPKKVKKFSIFQRLLMHNLFSARRKTTPKETVPKARSSYDSGRSLQIKENIKPTPQNRRILLQSSSKPAESPSLEFSYITGPVLDCDSAKSYDQMDNATSSRTSRNGVSEVFLPTTSLAPQVSNAKNFAASNVSTSNANQNTIQLRPLRQIEQAQEHRAPYNNQQLFARTRSMDRSEILRRSRAVVPLRTVPNDHIKPNRSNTQSIISNIVFEPSGPQTTSTPIRKKSAAESQQKLCNSSSTLASSVGGDDVVNSNSNISKSDWLRLREQQQLQQHTDRELYSQVLNRKAQNNENLYERLPIQSIQVAPAEFQPIYSSVDQRCYFVRGGPQRNTFSGVSRETNFRNYNNNIDVVDEQTHSENNFQVYRPGNESLQQRNQPSRLSQNNTLSREEIIEKVKQFCRNSIRRNNEKQILQRKTNDVRLSGTEISPASYASVETQQFFPISRKTIPQVPQRIQSLPRQQDMAKRALACRTTPIYANVLKDGSSMPMQRPGLPHGIQYPRAESIPNRLKERMTLENPVNERQHIEPNVRMVQATSRYASENMLSNGGSLIKPIAKPPRCSSVINSPSQLSLQPVQNNGRSTPLILARSQNLQSQIYQPKYRDSRLQHNTNERHIALTNQRFGQYISGSLELQPEVNKDQFTDSLNLGQQPPAQYFERYLPETAEIQRIDGRKFSKEDWQNENKSGRQQTNDQVNDERRRSSRREDPRRHTLGGDMLQYGVMQGQPQQRSMDLEMGMRTQKNKKNQPVRSYAPVNQGPLFDDDPGIMSEVETASTGFRRGGKQRSSLPVVRTPSKTLERPLGLVFLQYRSETKRALLPNEITSIDTVRALFVRSFPRQLTMAYLEGPNVKIYIHDASKDMFYELEDVRSHLREIRDRSVLRLFESNEVAAPPQVLPGGPGIPQPLPQAVPMQWDQDQSYFSEPEFDSEYQHQHIHKSKPGKQPPYYVGASQTLPRGMYSDRNKVPIGAPAKPLRSYGSRGNMGPIFPYPPDQLYSIPDGYTSSPERGTRGSYEEPYYSQYGTRGNVVAPIIDEESSDVAMTEDQYALYGMKMGPGRIPRTANQMYDPTRPEDLHRIRVEHMERQLANLTGLVQKALVNQNPQIAPAPVPTMNPNYLGVPAQCRDAIEELYGLSGGSHISIQANGTGEEIYVREKAPKLGKSSCHKSVSFEKSVSFSDDIQGVPKSHSPQHAADTKPTKPAIKSSTLPRTSSQERDRLKPPPPPKPIALTQPHSSYRADIALAPEVYNHLRGLQKKAKDLRMEVRTLRRLSQAQAVAVREDIKDAFMRIRATLLASSGNYWDQQGDQEKTRISREEELYKQEIIRLEKDLSDLESSVEGLRGEVINRRTRVNMAAVEDMALVLSRASKTVAELKLRFPGLSNGVRNLISNEMEKVVREEKFLKEEPDRLESALRRCKKLTGTLVTLKRLASVQEQRLPPNEPTASEDTPCSAEISTANKQPIPTPRMGPIAISGGVPPENALDALLDELQTFAKPLNQHNDFRPDDSTSDDSSQAIPSTVTTQIPQACLYNPNDPNAAQQPQLLELQEPITVMAGAPQNVQGMNNANMLQVNANLGSLRRLHSYPSGSDTDTSPPQPARMLSKPPVPERNAELLSKVTNKRVPPPPPPRTSSRSPLASPTSPNVPHRMPSLSEMEPLIGNGSAVLAAEDGSGNSSGNESGNDQVQRQVALERRHQELLRKQKMLQEQYQRLQQMSKMPAVATMPPPPNDVMQLKKTGSESNLPLKMDLSIASATGSMKNLNSEANTCTAGTVTDKNEKNIQLVKQQLIDLSKGGTPQPARNEQVVNVGTEPDVTVNNSGKSTTTTTTIKQVYETEIL